MSTRLTPDISKSLSKFQCTNNYRVLPITSLHDNDFLHLLSTKTNPRHNQTRI